MRAEEEAEEEEGKEEERQEEETLAGGRLVARGARARGAGALRMGPDGPRELWAETPPNIRPNPRSNDGQRCRFDGAVKLKAVCVIGGGDGKAPGKLRL